MESEMERCPQSRTGNHERRVLELIVPVGLRPAGLARRFSGLGGLGRRRRGLRGIAKLPGRRCARESALFVYDGRPVTEIES